MKVGDLVVVSGSTGRPGTPALGIILREVKSRSNSWGDAEYTWWEVLDSSGRKYVEVKSCLEHVG